jgi:metal-sulfur cluster biosynthetic enzyme
MVTEPQIVEALRGCEDPEVGISIVDLGLVYKIDIGADGKVRVKMTLTSIGCPIAPMIRTDVQEKVGKLEGVKSVEVEFVFDPPWSPDKMTPEAKAMLGYV